VAPAQHSFHPASVAAPVRRVFVFAEKLKKRTNM
jgi:hypothetical protein